MGILKKISFPLPALLTFFQFERLEDFLLNDVFFSSRNPLKIRNCAFLAAAVAVIGTQAKRLSNSEMFWAIKRQKQSVIML